MATSRTLLLLAKPKRLILAGAALTFASFLGYDLATYFHLPPMWLLICAAILFAGLAALLAGVLQGVWRASAGKLAAVGFAISLGFAMAAVSPTMFAPPGIQGGEREIFHGVPLVLAVAGALLLLLAGGRFLQERHTRASERADGR
jgi:hypothetical protein